MKKIIIGSLLLINTIISYGQKQDKPQITDTIKINVQNNLILAKVYILKKDYTFIVDLESPTIVSPKLMFTVNNQLKKTDNKVLLPEVKIGSTSFIDVTVETKNLEVFKKHNVDGIIGVDIMKKYVLNFDLRDEKIILLKDFSLLDVNPEYTTIYELYPYRKSVRDRTLKEEEVDMIFMEFGNKELFNLSFNTFLTLKKERLILKKIDNNEVYMPMSSNQQLLLNDVALDVNIKNIQDTVCVVNSDLKFLKIENILANKISKNIAFKMLSNYRTIIDFKGKGIYLTPFLETRDTLIFTKK